MGNGDGVDPLGEPLSNSVPGPSRPASWRGRTREQILAGINSPAGVAPAKKKTSGCGCLLSALGLIVCVAVIAAVLSGGSSSTPSGASDGGAPSAPPATFAAPQPATTALTDSGDGIETTEQFNATGHWHVDYTFDCHDFGEQGNFILDVVDDSGNEVDSLANALDVRGSDTSYSDYQGTASLKVNSECAWTVNVVVGG